MLKMNLTDRFVNVNEGFDGIRKDNSSKIFYTLLLFIIIDSIYCIYIN